jgi:hypothetical protein
MAQPSQGRAIASYRRRLGERRLCRYEVRGLELASEVVGAAPCRGGTLRPVARYLIDTNIVGEATRPRPSPAWFSAQDDHDLFVATLTQAAST